MLNQEERQPQKSFIARPITELTLGGITSFTTIDFPGRLAAVLYTQGCAWRCHYCHNSHLWPFESEHMISFKKVIPFLESRRGLLDGVVFCGGEPTAHEQLPEAMSTIKEMGFQVALHTTGMYPERLKAALVFCDWVGMDIKSPFGLYEKITQKAQSGVQVRKSVSIVLESGVDYEFRTTVHPALLSEEDILEIACDLSTMGASNFILQSFQSKGCLDPALKANPIPRELVSKDLEKKLSSFFKNFNTRC